MFTVGTAGHVDHGKSTLITALTGIDPDRLSEEKARGMTIDLGFAWLTLPSGREISLVDVPGHERFVPNMLAGAGGVDACLLVVAADEGVMPQTREHVDILDLFGVSQGVIVLTKMELVDAEWMALVEGDVRSALQGTALASAPMVRVSAVTRQGLDALLTTLDAVLDAAPERPDLGRPRLPIDRAFSMPGFGTVVTGTLSGGQMRVGAELGIFPGSVRARVRGLQSHRAAIESALPGQRVAVNLAGVTVEQAPRGAVVGSEDAVAETRRVDATLRLLPGVPRALKAGESVAWHAGTAEVVASVRYLESEPVAPGAEGWVQWRFDAPVALARGDRYVIRRLSPPLTIGGGTVVRATTRHLPRGDAEALHALGAAAAADPEALVMAALDRAGPLALPALVKRLGLPTDDVAACMERGLASGRLVTLGDALCTPRRADELRRQLVAAVAAHHAQAPTAGGADRTALRAELGIGPAELAALVELSQAAGEVRPTGARVALLAHQVVLTAAQAAAAARLLAALDAGSNSPPGLEASAQRAGAQGEVIAALVADGRLVRLAPDVAVSAAGYVGWTAEVRALFAAHPQVTVADVRDRLHTSRKYALALLEHLDAQAITRRVGDARVLIAR